MVEKRKFIRLNAAIGVSYKLIKKHKRQIELLSLARDIGGGGIRILAKEDLRPGDLLKIEIEIPHLSERVEATGEVIWFSKTKEKGHEHKEAGVRFRDMDSTDLHKILEYVHSIGIG